MPQWDENGGRVPTTLFEAAAFQHMVRVECRCGHVAILQSHALWWWFNKRGLDERLKHIGPRFKCTKCPRRGWVMITLTHQQVTAGTLPLPPSGEWKRAVNRFRN